MNLWRTAFGDDVYGSKGGLRSGILIPIDRPMVRLLSNYRRLTHSDETMVLNQSFRLIAKRVFGTNFFAGINMDYHTRVLLSIPYGINV